MWDDIVTTYHGFQKVFAREDRLPWSALLPLLAMGVTWPMLTLAMPSEREAFMVAFMLAVGLRFGLRAEASVRRLNWLLQSRRALFLSVLAGPAIFGLMVMAGDPVVCQRFLSVYFLFMAALYLLDVVTGGHIMTRYFLPSERPAGADALLTRVMAVFYLGLVLVNEAMIHQSSLALWLMYFGLLPLVTNRVALALRRTVELAWARGYGRF